MKPLYLPTDVHVYIYIYIYGDYSRGKVMMMTGYRLKKRTRAL